jgi:hypothetical protein
MTQPRLCPRLHAVFAAQDKAAIINAVDFRDACSLEFHFLFIRWFSGFLGLVELNGVVNVA